MYCAMEALQQGQRHQKFKEIVHKRDDKAVGYITEYSAAT
jgi:hypothetical protein